MGVHVPIMQMRKLKLRKVRGLALVPQRVSGRQGQDLDLGCSISAHRCPHLGGVVPVSNTALYLYYSLYANLGDRHPVVWSLDLKASFTKK